MRYALKYVNAKRIIKACKMHHMTFDDRPSPAIRLQQARERRGFKSAKAAAEYFGWSVATYIQHENGQRGLVRAAARYAKAFRISEGWLLTGDGDAPGPAIPLVSLVSAGKLEQPNGYIPSDEFVTVPAGGLPAGDWIALRVEGDSMDDYSPPGSIIFVNRRERDPVDGGFYVVCTDDGEATYKRYRANPERLEPQSSNKAHETIFPQGSLTIIGRVRRTMLDFPA
ncbi:UNVERIFIED_ORG: SOS-response transcriptional repressor LexA [Martelella mediterranea]